MTPSATDASSPPVTSARRPRVLVIGAGLSGLATAWALARGGANVHVIEAAERPGGLIGSETTPHGLVERAANGFVWTGTVERWFADLALTPTFATDARRRRFIFVRGRPRRWPLGVGETAVAAARLSAAWATGRLRPERHESVAAFGTRVAGRGATEHLLAPALNGIYAAPPEMLSASAIFGSRRRRRGRIALAAPAGGMGELIGTLHQRLVERGVTFQFGCRLDALPAGTPTAICTDARNAAELLASHTPALAAALRQTPMASLVTATAFFEPNRDDLDGFGVLFARGEGVRALGCLFPASIFPSRSGLRAETWIYGTAPPASSLPSSSELAETISADRQVLTRRPALPVAVVATRHEPALPVYGPSILAVRDALSGLPPWLALAGNYLGRIGVADLLDGAERAAERLMAVSAPSDTCC